MQVVLITGSYSTYIVDLETRKTLLETATIEEALEVCEDNNWSR